MFTLYQLNSKPKVLSKEEAAILIYSKSELWNNENISEGKLYTEKLEPVFLGQYSLRAYIPKHKKFASDLLNNAASKVVGFDVYGECLLEK